MFIISYLFILFLIVLLFNKKPNAIIASVAITMLNLGNVNSLQTFVIVQLLRYIISTVFKFQILLHIDLIEYSLDLFLFYGVLAKQL